MHGPFAYPAGKPSLARCLGAVTAAAALLAAAAATPARAVEFDPPETVERFTTSDGKETICSHFLDVTVFERRDGPTAESPVVVDDPHAGCEASLAAKGRDLGLPDMAFDGRAGVMLYFSQMDAHGAVDFAVVEPLERKVVLRDSAVGEPLIRTAELGRSAYELTYLRGVNASCSLYANAARCWSQMIGEGRIPAEMASVAPSGTICAKSYAETKAPRDVPSIITWSTTAQIFPDGSVRRTDLHDFGCLPMP